MSVIVTARLHKSAQDIERANRQESQPWRKLTDCAREGGCLDHKVISAGDEALLVEEWSDTGVFEACFDGTPSYRQAIDEAGFRGFPDDIKLWHPIPSGD
jgi:hypothetical protein